MVEVGDIASIAVAIATAALAVITYLTIRQSKNQLRALLSQNALLRSQQYPILRVDSFSFSKNVIKVTVSNVGDGIATNIGLSANFYPAVIAFSDKDGIILQGAELQKAVNEYREGKKELYFKYQPHIGNLIHNGVYCSPEGIVISLSTSSAGGSMLAPRETKEFQTEIKFLVNEALQAGTEMKTLSFDELKSFLNETDIHFAALDFSIKGKDLLAKLLESPRVEKFVVDLEQDNSIEDAFAKQRRADFLPLSLSEMTAAEFWLPEPIYDRTRPSAVDDTES